MLRSLCRLPVAARAIGGHAPGIDGGMRDVIDGKPSSAGGGSRGNSRGNSRGKSGSSRDHR